MITLRRAEERRHDHLRGREIWRTFHPGERGDALAGGFGLLESLDEDLLRPGAGGPSRPHCNVEIVTYVREGGLLYAGSVGGQGVIRAGEFQRMTAGIGIRHREANASRSRRAHVFHISLRPSEGGREPGYEQRRFSAAERRGKLCVVASADAREGSLRIHPDALVCTALLASGQHLAHELLQGRSGWLHLVEGEVTLGDVVLTTGDGAGITAERAVSLTAQTETEILLLDLGEQESR